MLFNKLIRNFPLRTGDVENSLTFSGRLRQIFPLKQFCQQLETPGLKLKARKCFLCLQSIKPMFMGCCNIMAGVCFLAATQPKIQLSCHFRAQLCESLFQWSVTVHVGNVTRIACVTIFNVHYCSSRLPISFFFLIKFFFLG